MFLADFVLTAINLVILFLFLNRLLLTAIAESKLIRACADFSEHAPTFDNEAPTFDDEAPTFDDEAPTFDDDAPTFDADAPTFDDSSSVCSEDIDETGQH